MGRRKIEIQPLKNDRNRTVTFTKRKAGLFKKAHELAVLCEVDISVIIIGRNHKIYQYSSDKTEDILQKFINNQNNLYESKLPKDYGNYELKSRILNSNLIKHNNNHKYSNSLSGISNHFNSLNGNFKNHFRSKSDSTNLDNNNRNETDNDEEEDDEEDDDEEEDDDDDDDDKEEEEEEEGGDEEDENDEDDHNNTNNINDTQRNEKKRNKTKNIKKRSNKSFDSKPNKRNKTSDDNNNNNNNSSSYIYSSPIDPKTPVNDIQKHPFTTNPSANVTPYHSSSALKRSKLKENNSLKRPTLSLKIPNIDNRNLSDVSTITAGESSNKSVTVSSTSKGTNGSDEKNNNLNIGIGLNSNQNIEQIQRKYKINNEFNKSKNNNDNMNITLPSPTFNLTYTTSSSNSSNTKTNQTNSNNLNNLNNLNNINNSTPLPSALFKDKKSALYTPTTTNFLNMIGQSNPGETPLNQLGYFNFNGMSPTQLLVPSFPLPPLTSNVSSGSIQIDNQQNSRNSNERNNKNNYTSNNSNNNENGNENQNENENQNQNENENENNTNINKSNFNTKNRIKNSININSNLRINTNIDNIDNNNNNNNKTGLITNSNQLQTPIQNQTNNNVQNHQPFLPPMNSATSIYFPQSRISTNQRHHHQQQLLNNSNNSNNNNNNNNQQHSHPHPTINTSINLNGNELPTLSAELSGLPSKYVDFQSPNTLFTHDWQLPNTGTTPIINTTHQLPIVQNNNNNNNNNSNNNPHNLSQLHKARSIETTNTILSSNNNNNNNNNKVDQFKSKTTSKKNSKKNKIVKK